MRQLAFYLWCLAIPTCMSGHTAAQPAAQATDRPDWTTAVRAIHTRFHGTPGTFAQFGDSITETMAFWAPLPYARKHAPSEMDKAFEAVQRYIRPECWREWKGPEFGNQGGQTTQWALDHVDSWLKKLNPECAVVLFGTNDLPGLDVSEYARRLRALVRKCLDNGTVVILCTVPPRHGFEQKASAFADAARQLARDLRLPITDLYAEMMRHRPQDWDGALDRYSRYDGYDVPTLIARDGVHPSHPAQFADDYSEEALRSCGYSLRNYLTLLEYARVIRVLRVPNQSR